MLVRFMTIQCCLIHDVDPFVLVALLVGFMTMVLSRHCNVGHIHGDGPFLSLQCWSDSWGWSLRRYNVGHIHGDGHFVVTMLVRFMGMVTSSLQCWSDSWGWSLRRYNVGQIHGDGHFVVTMLVRFMTMVLSRQCNVGQIHDDSMLFDS